MPLSNPFRRQSDRPSLRERAADLRSSVANAIRKPKPETAPEQSAPTLEEFGQIDFNAYVFDFPVKAPQEWSDRFSEYGLAMHIADRTVRMTKPELMAFIRSEGEQDAEVPATIFRAIDTAGETFEGWGNLLKLARARYIVAASAELITPLTSEEEASSAAQAEVAMHPATSFQEQVEQAGRTADILASSGIDHRDGTVSYADATGKVVRRPMAHWIAFTAQQMHGRVQNEISRREIIEANHLPMADRIAWDDDIRCELRSDAVHALTFRHLRAFEAARAIRGGSELAFPGARERDDAKLLSLVPAWEAAVDLYQQRIDEEEAVCEAAGDDGWPGVAPAESGPEWQAWFAQKETWRARTGFATAEEATSEAGTALHRIEVQIGELAAASLAGLKFKARVAQRSDDNGVDWPDNLGVGLARDIVALTDAAAKRAEAKPVSFVEQIDFPASTLAELLAIRDVAKCVGDVASALTWGGRCHRRRNAHGAFEYNAAGMLVTAISDALTAVEVEAEREGKRRVPADADEQSTRLFMLAPGYVDNDDPDEIEALGREILAHAEAIRSQA